MDDEYADDQKRKIMSLRRNGFIVSTTDNMKFDCDYAIIDQNIVWYGNLNILARTDEDNDILRFTDASAASSLLQNALRQSGIQPKTYALRTRLDI